MTVPRAATLIDVSYPPANEAVDRLEANRLLAEQTGQERSREFQATEVLDVLNRDVGEMASLGVFVAERRRIAQTRAHSSGDPPR